ncbi:hypothetical protein IW492_11640 [Enterococcus sp. BWB1-3]|uniref:hypothetical protein n=1 Tax=unclassified Enterococcus TaxID=2608891 RepID=UPI001920C039|nr:MULTISPECIES: hypothetical protein [unclassified Enterococcus]MBL1229884.1 hypothetical protein [Enterococcus sp. BWB1-3]MCB5951400.1 hypothetical protein [Enterococcus sp. BWT-B8]MCB5954959.1 hypothetical protein [Enterococcus sp. CWB-B31]
MQSYQSIVFELTLYYLIAVISLPLVYAVTYHLPFTGIFSAEWLGVSIMLYPIVFLLSGLRYSLQRIRSRQKNSH